MKRLLLVLLVGYAALATFFAASCGVRAWFYRRCFDSLMRGKHGHPVHFPGLMAIARDFDMPLSPWEYAALSWEDRHSAILTGLLIAVAISLLVAARASGSRTHPEPDPRRSSRTVVRAALVAWVLGAALTGWMGWLARRQALHPHYLLALVLFAGLVASTAVAIGGGLWELIRGSRRGAALLVVVAIVPLGFWASVGLYGRSCWHVRFVPHNLMMNLAKVAAAMIFRLEAEREYPNRIVTDRLVMLYDRLDDPARDAQAMDEHLRRLEQLLGSPLREKVFWIRGRLRALDLGPLSIHGIAIGSGQSPSDWQSGGRLDRHELAHAALDAYRTAGADPPFLVHEGWAERNGGASEAELAEEAIRLRNANPRFGIRDLFAADRYHLDDGEAYGLGGAFVDFLVRTYGVASFVRFYNSCRPDTYASTFQECFGTELHTAETQFWEGLRRRAEAGPGQPIPVAETRPGGS